MSQIHFCNDGTFTFTGSGTSPEGYASVCINNGGEKISTTPIQPKVVNNSFTFRVLEDISNDIGKCLEWEDFGSGYGGKFQTIRGPMCLVKENKFVLLKAGDIIRTNGFAKNSQGEFISIKIPYGNNGESISISMANNANGSSEKFQLMKGNYLTKADLKAITNDLEITTSPLVAPPDYTLQIAHEQELARLNRELMLKQMAYGTPGWMPSPYPNQLSKKVVTAGFMGLPKTAWIAIVGVSLYYAYSKGMLKELIK